MHGIGDDRRLSLGASVQAADDTLKLGKLPDHFRGKVALGELGGTVGIGDVSLRDAQVEPLLGEPPRKRTQALDLLEVTAEARFVGDALEPGQDVAEAAFLVRLPEEAGVSKAGTEDTLV